jgi:hypothetical protein
MIRFALLTLVVSFPLAALAADPDSKELVSAREEYEKEVARAQKAIDDENAAIRKKYLVRLESLRLGWAEKGSNFLARAAKNEMDRVSSPNAEAATGAAPKIRLVGTRWKVPETGATVTFDTDTWLLTSWPDRKPRPCIQVGPQTWSATPLKGGRLLTVASDMTHILVTDPKGEIDPYVLSRLK